MAAVRWPRLHRLLPRCCASTADATITSALSSRTPSTRSFLLRTVLPWLQYCTHLNEYILSFDFTILYQHIGQLVGSTQADADKIRAKIFRSYIHRYLVGMYHYACTIPKTKSRGPTVVSEKKDREKSYGEGARRQRRHTIQTYIGTYRSIDLHNMYVGRYIPVSSTTGIRFFGNVYTDLW